MYVYLPTAAQAAQISFTGNLVLRHSVYHFSPHSGVILYWVVELNAALCLDTTAEKWKYKFKQIFHFLKWESKPQPVDFTVSIG